MRSPWDLIELKQYEEAIIEYSRLHREEPGRKSHLHNRGLAYLLMENYQAALDDFTHIIEAGAGQSQNDSEFIYKGIALWCLNFPNEAVETWRAGLSAHYTDAAGGVEVPALLLYAGCRLKDARLRKEAIRLLKKHWSKHVRRQQRRLKRSDLTHDDLVHPGLVAWPGAIVPFLLGEIDPAQLQQCVDEAGHDTLKQRYQCAADFYVGLRAACDDDMPTFQAKMKSCAEGRKRELEHESYLAHWEVERGFPMPAFPIT